MKWFRWVLISLLLLTVFCSCSDNDTTSSNASEETLSLKMSIAPAIENGFNVTKVTATIARDNYSYSKDLTISGTTAEGTFYKLAPGTYTISIEIYDGETLIAVGFGTGKVVAGENNIVYVTIEFVGDLTIVVDWSSYINVENFLDYEIDHENHNLELYRITNIEDIATAYQESGMEYFIQMDVHYEYLDENMIPMQHYSFGDYRNPVMVCNTAFGFYRYYLESGEDHYKQWFINNVEWLFDNLDDNNYLHYEFEWIHFDRVLDEDWISGMAQGEALAVFSMAYHLTGESKYLQAAERIFITLYRNTNSYWCFGVDNEGYYWLEEYPNVDFCHVLNGFLFGLWGLWNYYIVSGDDFALTLFQAGIKTIVVHYSIWNYEGENASIYCTHAETPTNYHQTHLKQLQKYSEFFNIPEFLDAIECFSH